jgi:hypothetical protein
MKRRQKATAQPVREPQLPIQEKVEVGQELPPMVAQAKRELDVILNEREKARTEPYSVQVPPTDDPITSAEGLIWWTGCQLDQFIPLAEYGTWERQRDMRTFALVAPLILLAESAMIKKCQALQWSVEGGRNKTRKWQNILNSFGDNAGWDTFVARWVRAYLESDFGGYAEIIRAAPSWALDENRQLTPRGEAAVAAGRDAMWEIVDARTMDPVQTRPTRSQEFPLIYENKWTGERHQLRPYQFMHLVDMPNVDDSFPGQGICAISRAVWAAQEDRMDIRFYMEKLSENPGAGLVFGNFNPKFMETALKSAESQRNARGMVYYKGLIFIPVLNPDGQINAQLINFSGLPDGFDRTDEWNRLKEIVASAFGLDVMELGSMPGQNLGTGAQATVQAAKSRGKGVGSITQGIEREFRFKLLPEDLEFAIKKHDPEEEKERAELDSIYFGNMSTMIQRGWSLEMANQYLADKGAIPREFIAVDITPNEELEDVEATEKRWKRDGPRVRIDRYGKVLWVENAYAIRSKSKDRRLGGVLDSVIANYKAGDVSADDVAQFALAELVEMRGRRATTEL